MMIDLNFWIANEYEVMNFISDAILFESVSTDELCSVCCCNHDPSGRNCDNGKLIKFYCSAKDLLGYSW